MERLKILVPTDFTVQAEFAHLLVRKLEEKVPIEIHFLHVLPVPDTVTMDVNGIIQTNGEIDINFVIKQKEIAESKLATLKSLYGNNIHTHLVLGKITDAIVDYSDSNQYDLIVMGTKGSWGLMEKLSGSEAQIIARKSKTPLLSLLCDQPDLQIQHLLLVHDFGKPRQEDLKLIHRLINAFDAKLHLLQITSWNDESDRLSVEGNMKKFAALNGIDNYECHLVNDKDIENGVIHFNQMNTMDIICIGTHGKGGVFHQSATEKLINHLFKPIFSFHLNK